MHNIYLHIRRECITGTGKFVQCSDSVFSASASVIKQTVSLIWYLQPRSSLHTPQEMGIGEQATIEAKAAVAEVIGNSGHCNSRKRKRYTSFSDEDRAAIGRHAAENSNVSAL